MTGWLTEMLGETGATYTSYALGGIIVLIAAWIAWGLIVRISRRLRLAGNRKRARLAIIEAASIDGKRRIVLVRRDEVEHLVMIGGENDLVIEAGIARNASDMAQRGQAKDRRQQREPVTPPATRRAPSVQPSQRRPVSAPDAGPRAVPAGAPLNPVRREPEIVTARVSEPVIPVAPQAAAPDVARAAREPERVDTARPENSRLRVEPPAPAPELPPELEQGERAPTSDTAQPAQISAEEKSATGNEVEPPPAVENEAIHDAQEGIAERVDDVKPAEAVAKDRTVPTQRPRLALVKPSGQVETELSAPDASVSVDPKAGTDQATPEQAPAIEEPADAPESSSEPLETQPREGNAPEEQSADESEAAAARGEDDQIEGAPARDTPSQDTTGAETPAQPEPSALPGNAALEREMNRLLAQLAKKD